jgi:hypothetical protein
MDIFGKKLYFIMTEKTYHMFPILGSMGHHARFGKTIFSTEQNILPFIM